MSPNPTPQIDARPETNTSRTGPAVTAAEAELERIRAAAREAARQFPPMSSELVTLVRNGLRGRTR